jgi:predicted dehydrogenase
MNVFFIGMGYMGSERLKAIINLQKKYKINVLGFYDTKIKSIKINNNNFKCTRILNSNFFEKNKIDLCVISVPHNLTYHYSNICLKNSKHISLLIEKPLGINHLETKKIINLKNKNQKIFVGLNYRYFDGISQMLKDIKANKFGKINSLLINFGHGHNPTMRKSWKLNKKYAGGGVIIDPGIHILNLLQLFCSKIKIKYLRKINNFWKTGIEEEVIILLSSKEIPIISISLSILRWRSTLDISGNGIKGYWRIKGRDRSYGNQTYLTGRRWAWLSGKKQQYTEKIYHQKKFKNVFQDELEAIIKILNNKKTKILPCTDQEALKTMTLIKSFYEY